MASSPMAKPPLYRFRPWSSVFVWRHSGGATKPMSVPVSSASRKLFPENPLANRRELISGPREVDMRLKVRYLDSGSFRMRA